MKITIEIDVQPDELRRFLGLPDIVGLQEDIIAYMKEKAAAAADLSPTDFVRQNLDSFGVTSTLKKFVHGAKKATGLGDDEDDEDEDAGAAPPRRRRRAAPGPDDESALAPGSHRAAAGVEPLRSYDESSQVGGTASGVHDDDALAEADRGPARALDAAEEIGAALAAVPRRALRSLRARAPSFGFNLDAARERRARARAEAAAAGPAGEPNAAPLPAADAPATDPSAGTAPDPDEVF